MHPIVANTSTTFSFARAAARDLTWVRLGNGRLLPVDTATSKFITLIDTRAGEDSDANEDAMLDLAKVLSYGLCGDEYEFERAFEDIIDTSEHRPLGNGIHWVEGSFQHWDQREQFAWCELLTLEQIKVLEPTEAAKGLGVTVAEIRSILGTVGNDYGAECVISLVSGREIRFPASPDKCSYVRITLPGIVPLELAYWTSAEWGEAPAEVMGAILGAAHGRI